MHFTRDSEKTHQVLTAWKSHESLLSWLSKDQRTFAHVVSFTRLSSPLFSLLGGRPGNEAKLKL
jgi:proteasome lid subunit RPN8/RPN11